MTAKKLAPMHPGEVLLEEFLTPLGLSQNKLALSVGVSPRRINEIVSGSVASLRRRRYAWHGTSTRSRSSGSVFRLTTTRTLPPTSWAGAWNARSMVTSWRPDTAKLARQRG